MFLVARPATRLFTPDDIELLYERLKDVLMLAEGERIAREMHDGLAQQLGHLYLNIGKLQLHPCSEPIQGEQEPGRQRLQPLPAVAPMASSRHKASLPLWLRGIALFL